MNIIVESSKIRGRGLFAQKDLKKGETILGWNEKNKFLTKEEVEALPEDLKHFIAIFKGQYLLIAEPERYMNHSCDPNAETAEDGTDIALRDIQQGEEITGDYARMGTLVGFECRCGNANCRKFIPSSKLD